MNYFLFRSRSHLIKEKFKSDLKNQGKNHGLWFREFLETLSIYRPPSNQDIFSWLIWKLLYFFDGTSLHKYPRIFFRGHEISYFHVMNEFHGKIPDYFPVRSHSSFQSVNVVPFVATWRRLWVWQRCNKPKGKLGNAKGKPGKSMRFSLGVKNSA